MKKIKWSDLIGLLAALVIPFGFLNPDYYDEFVKHPLDNGSGSTSSRLFYLLLFKIDQYIGEMGIFIFLVLLILFFSYRFIKANIFTFSEIYQKWKEKK
jgi:hypothetical protein